MKKYLVLFFLSALMCQSFAQEMIENETETTNCLLKKGDYMVDLFVGFPNFYQESFNNFTNSQNLQNTKSSFRGIGPFGARLEYMLTENFGLGIETAYVRARSEYIVYSPFNDSIMEKSVTTKYKLGIIATFNYHVYQIEQLDIYLTGGLGYKISKYKTEGFYTTYSDGVNFPVAWRFGVGARFFILPKWGLTLNAGVGQGGFVNFGTSFRF